MTQKPTLKELIAEHEQDLRVIRSKYFPLITQGTITGYNLYAKLFDYAQGRLFLHYLHSDLKPTDEHFRLLSRKLRQRGLLEEKVIINTGVIGKEKVTEREADYVTKAYWEDSPHMRYFDFDGNEIPVEKAKSLDEDVIGEVLQYDWLIKADNETELRALIDCFKKYASKFVLDRKGRKVIEEGRDKENKYAVPQSWEVPLLVCATTGKRKPGMLDDFLRVNQFNIPERLGNTPIVVSTLVRGKSKEFQEYLVNEGLAIQPEKRYALRVFVEDYIDA